MHTNKNDIQKALDALEQMKKERDEWEQKAKYLLKASKESIQSFSSELAAKDKVLEWYADNAGKFFIDGERARSILSQYRKE
jgi:hypothetical protein